ncbi:MAG: hypothetical protein FJ125_17000 [Deltaproteobacteria bacterium]|nr:hypothetical protein [Deltaproteobacteria bacterium]
MRARRVHGTERGSRQPGLARPGAAGRRHHTRTAGALPGLLLLALGSGLVACAPEEPPADEAAALPPELPPDLCQPRCDAESCAMEDGCGGRCPCSPDASCLSCPLRLVRVVDPAAGEGTLTVSLWSSQVAGVPLPKLAELVIAADRPVQLQQVALGASLAAARKRLHRFTTSERPWQQLTDGSFRLLVYSGTQHLDIPPGRWLSLRFARTGGDATAGPVSFRLMRNPGGLAPAAADQALQETRYHTPLLFPAATMAR